MGGEGIAVENEEGNQDMANFAGNAVFEMPKNVPKAGVHGIQSRLQRRVEGMRALPPRSLSNSS
jgi:hypothetical protein